MEGSEKLVKILIKILRANRLCERPGYYSGRGATLTDLNGEILEGIYKGIKKEFGEKAAKNFVKMVDGIKVISATTFLQELYALEWSKWEYKEKEKDESGVYVDKINGEYNMAGGMFGMINALTHNGSDDTRAIKQRFVRSHGIVPPKGTIECDIFGYYRTY
jgi:plasmid maintenance system killer protein